MVTPLECTEQIVTEKPVHQNLPIQCTIHALRTYSQLLRIPSRRAYKYSRDPGCSERSSFVPLHVERTCESRRCQLNGERVGEGGDDANSTSSQKSRVSEGKRTLLNRRRRFGAQRNAMKLPRPRPTFVSKAVVNECKAALAALAHREGLGKARGEADRSLHAHAGAAEDDDDDDCQVLGVTPSRTMLRPGKNVLPLTDSKGVRVSYAADVTKQARVVFRKSNCGIDELWIYSTPAQGLIRPEVEADKEAARLKAAREKRVASQIRFLENQVHIYNVDAVTLKRAFDAWLARTVRNTCPRARNRQIRKCFMSVQAIVAENAATAWLFYENRLEAMKAELKDLLHGNQPFAAAREQTGCSYNWKAEMANAIVQEIVNGRK